MEPGRLNSSASDPLDRLLAQAKPEPITDDGFSTRVLSALPAPAMAHSPVRWTRPVAVATGAALGVALLWTHSDDSAAVAKTTADAIEQLLQPQVGLALLAAAATLVVVYLPELRRKLSV